MDKTNVMRQMSSRDASSHSASQATPYKTRKFITAFTKAHYFCPESDEYNQILMSNIIDIHFNIILLSIPRSEPPSLQILGSV